MGQKEHIPYPKSVLFIVSNEFCERFSFYGMRTILVIYLTNILNFSDPDAKITYHMFTVLVYTFPLLGAIISDSWLGKFKTIFYLSIVYALGNVLISIAAMDDAIGIPALPFSMLGLLVIAIGTGGIKPCVAAFGGDQFVMPQQEKQMATFFSLFYFSINAGSFISTFLTPLLRHNVQCLDKDSCYPLAFGVPAILMAVSIVVFAIGRRYYKVNKPTGNVFVDVMKCMGHAIKRKMKSDKKLDHWLDHSEEKYGKKLVNDIKITLRVLVLYIPIPVFWALYDQQGSGWTLQAVRMSGDIGFYTILPDQMQIVNPLLILAFIPLFTYWVYPLLAKCNLLTKPLQRMTCGGFLAVIAFVISACISLAIEATAPELPGEGSCQVRIYNPSNCATVLKSEIFPADITLAPMSYHKIDVDVKGNNKTFDYTMTPVCPNPVGLTQDKVDQIYVSEEDAVGYYLSDTGFYFYEDDVDKSEDGLPRVRTLTAEGNQVIYLDSDKDEALTVPGTNDTLLSIDPGTYTVAGFKQEFEFKLGGTYTVLLRFADNTSHLEEITEPNDVHMLLLIPQYVVLTAGEIMFSITGLEFAYSQAPTSMKSVLQAFWLLTTAVGNLIIVIIESSKIFEKQSLDFFLYAGLMCVDLIVLTWLAYRYKYTDIDETNDEEELDKKDSKQVNAIENPAFKDN